MEFNVKILEISGYSKLTNLKLTLKLLLILNLKSQKVV